MTVTAEKVRRKFSYFCFDFEGVGFVPNKKFVLSLLKVGEGEFIFDGYGFVV